MMLHSYRVGEPYNPRLTLPEVDTWQYNWRGSGHELIGFLRRPTMQESREVRESRAEFGLFVEGDLLLLLHRFGRGEWADSPYSYHLVPPAEQVLPDPGDEGGDQARLLTVILVDRADGRIAAPIRVLSLPPDFAAALHEAIREQAGRPWPGSVAYDRQLADLYRRYPSSAMLLRDARARAARLRDLLEEARTPEDWSALFRLVLTVELERGKPPRFQVADWLLE